MCSLQETLGARQSCDHVSSWLWHVEVMSPHHMGSSAEMCCPAPFHRVKCWEAPVSPSPCAGGGCRRGVTGCTCPWGVNIPSPAWEGDYWRAVFFCAQNSLPSLQDCVKHSGYLKKSCCSSRCTKALEERSLIYSDGFFMTSFFPKILCHCDFPLCSYSCHRTWVWPFGPFPHFLLSSPLSLPFIFYFFMFTPKVRVLLKNLAWLLKCLCNL